MSSRKPPALDQLRTFLAVYRSGSFSDAARQLDVSQPTVTNHIGTLEKWFSEVFFVRSARGVTPTLFAHEMAAAVGGQMDQIARVVSGANSDVHSLHAVSLSGPREFIAHCVLPSLQAEVGRLPRLDFSFGPSRDLIADLEAGKVDLVISTIRPQHPEVVSWPVADEEFWLVASPDVEIPEGSLSKLSALPMVAYNNDLAIIRRYWNSVYNAEPLFDPAMVLSDLAAIKAAVISGFGLSVLPSYLVAAEVDSGDLVRVDPPEEPPINTVFLAAQAPALQAREHIASMARLLVSRIRAHQRTLN